MNDVCPWVRALMQSARGSTLLCLFSWI